MSIGKRIRVLRESRLQSLEELAAAARIPTVTLAQIEADDHYPRLSELERLLQALHVRFHDLLPARG